MKDETKKTIETIADTLEDTAAGLDTVYDLVALAHTEVGDVTDETDKIYTLLNAALDLINNHSRAVQYLSDKLKELI